LYFARQQRFCPQNTQKYLARHSRNQTEYPISNTEYPTEEVKNLSKKARR